MLGSVFGGNRRDRHIQVATNDLGDVAEGHCLLGRRGSVTRRASLPEPGNIGAAFVLGDVDQAVGEPVVIEDAVRDR